MILLKQRSQCYKWAENCECEQLIFEPHDMQDFLSTDNYVKCTAKGSMLHWRGLALPKKCILQSSKLIAKSLDYIPITLQPEYWLLAQRVTDGPLLHILSGVVGSVQF